MTRFHPPETFGQERVAGLGHEERFPPLRLAAVVGLESGRWLLRIERATIRPSGTSTVSRQQLNEPRGDAFR
jgi:hypothetical protein